MSKRIVTVFAALFLTAISGPSAWAECFAFYNGAGPDRVGSILLDGVASHVCVTKKTVTLKQFERTLVEIQAKVRRPKGSRGPILTHLDQGKMDGLNIDFRGYRLAIYGRRVPSPIGLVREVVISSTNSTVADEFAVLADSTK
jgi:hypothetical protein